MGVQIPLREGAILWVKKASPGHVHHRTCLAFAGGRYTQSDFWRGLDKRIFSNTLRKGRIVVHKMNDRLIAVLC